ncbi:MAG: uroporphyrinogen decarboxylase family protein [Promethearchaeota archaeon]
MLPRERIENAVSFHEIDRIPRDLGGPVSGISIIAYEKLLSYWNMSSNNIQVSDLIQQLAAINETVLMKLKIDTRHIGMDPPRREKLSKNGKIESFYNIYKIKYQYIRTSKYDPLYYEMVSYPLAEASLKEVKELKLPSPTEEWFIGCEKAARKYWEEGYAVVADAMSGGILEQTIGLRGFHTFLSDLYRNRELIEVLLDQNLTHQIQVWERWLSELGDWVTIAMYGDDYGTQERLLLHPNMWRELVKPRVKELIQSIKRNFPHIKIQLHSCGSIAEVIPDLIEIGFDILNPVQPAKGMDHIYLKQKYGSQICFHGGVDIQEVLPRGSPVEVENEVKRVLNALAKNKTGYIFAMAHNILADVPPENILAAYDALSNWKSVQHDFKD